MVSVVQQHKLVYKELLQDMWQDLVEGLPLGNVNDRVVEQP